MWFDARPSAIHRDIKTCNRWTRHSSIKQRTSTHTNSRFGEISVNKRIMRHAMYDNTDIFLRVHYFLIRLDDLSCNWKSQNTTNHYIVLYSEQCSFVYTTVQKGSQAGSMNVSKDIFRCLLVFSEEARTERGGEDEQISHGAWLAPACVFFQGLFHPILLSSRALISFASLYWFCI